METVHRFFWLWSYFVDLSKVIMGRIIRGAAKLHYVFLKVVTLFHHLITQPSIPSVRVLPWMQFEKAT